MMGSRGETAAAQSVAFLTAVSDLVALLKIGPDETLKQRLAELREEDHRVAAAVANLTEAKAAHDAREEELRTRAAELDEKEKSLVLREHRCAETLADTERRQATFDNLAAGLETRTADLEAREREFERTRELGEAQSSRDIEAAKATVAQTLADLSRQRREHDASLQRAGEVAAHAVAQMRAEADAELTQRIADVTAREQRIAAQEAELDGRLRQLRALLPAQG